MLLLLLIFPLCSAYMNNWFPIVSKSSTDFTNPKQIRVLGKDFVLWKKGEDVVLQDDVCPHRCAPLSEGYIDRKTNNLRCAYHGWEFNENGQCETIPQLKNDTNYKKRACVKNYPIFEYGDIIWGYLGQEPYKYTPDEKYTLEDNNPIFVRDIPYSLYIFLENFFDPAHIPFAHHKLQSVRDKGCPIDIQLLKNEEDLLSILFQIKDNEHEGMTMNFQLPCHYYLKPPQNITKPPMFLEQHMFLIPIQEDKTRIFITFKSNDDYKMLKWYKKLPIWFRHSLNNRFLDSDTFLLHKQEKYLQENNKTYHENKEYYMPATSDKSILHYRKWIKRTLPAIPYLKHKQEVNEMTRKEVFDRYEQHTKNCIYCKKALKNIIKIQKYGTLLFGMGFIYFRSILFAFAAYANYRVFDFFKKMFYFQDYIHNEID